MTATSLPLDLLPRSKPFRDIQAYKRRVRWTQGNLDEQSNRCTIVLPNEDAMSLNGRLRFDVAVAAGAGGASSSAARSSRA